MLKTLKIQCNEDAAVVMDASKFCRVIQNLVGNASKYNPEGTRIMIKTSISESGLFNLAVMDNGNGIPKEKLPELFRYKKRKQTTMNSEEGSFGMGLYIVREVIKMHNGEITVHSDENGTIFTILLSTNRETVEPQTPVDEKPLLQAEL